MTKAAGVKMYLDEPPKISLIAIAASHSYLAAKRKKASPDRKSIQSRSDDSSAQQQVPHQVKNVPRSIGFILILCLILQGPASWFTSSPLGKRAWDFFSYQPLSAQQLVLQLPELHQTKTNLPYDIALVRLMGGYGPMPGSDVNHNLEPEWRGHYLDWTGFYYMGARYYDPNTGRFLSADPLGHSASMNLYSYCNGDPVNGLDPDGRCVEGTLNAVPGQAAWQQTLSSLGNGNYGDASLSFGIMLSEQALTVATFGIGSAATAGGEVVTSIAAENAYFNNLMETVETLDVLTAQNEAVFHSGIGNRALAEEFATANSRMTLEKTPGGAWLDSQKLFNPDSPLTPVQATTIWSRLSQRFSEQASGNAMGFVNGARPNGIFNTIEFPTLQANPNIKNVITGGY